MRYTRDRLFAAALLPLCCAALALAPSVADGAQEARAREQRSAVGRIDHFVEHLGRPARLTFDADTREFVVVGEADRPLVFGQREGERGVWFTTIGDLSDVTEFEYLVREQGRRTLDLPDRHDPELPPEYFASEEFALVPVRFGARASIKVNANAGAVDVHDPSHYRLLTATEGLRAWILVGPERRLDLVLSEGAFDGRIFPGETLGDGAPERAGGVRVDLVLFGALDLLPANSLEWLGDVDANSKPIGRYVRPPF